MDRVKKYLNEMFVILFRTFGPQHWWPAETPFEVAIGAILTQNTNWQNVEKAISNLKEKGLLNPKGLYSVDEPTLAGLIRPAGYFNIKTRRIKSFVNFIMTEFNGRIEEMSGVDCKILRRKLLDVEGIGPETADSILLYALNKPVFVIDAYTKRVLLRHGIINKSAKYEELQHLFHKAIEPDAGIYNEYHALLVRLGKTYCKKNPLCKECPLYTLKGALPL